MQENGIGSLGVHSGIPCLRKGILILMVVVMSEGLKRSSRGDMMCHVGGSGACGQWGFGHGVGQDQMEGANPCIRLDCRGLALVALLTHCVCKLDEGCCYRAPRYHTVARAFVCSAPRERGP